MSTIKIDFCDFWPDFERQNNFLTHLLSRRFEIVISEDPDFVFFSTSGNNHKIYTCTKIFFTGESFATNFLECDYAISFDLEESARNIRYPLYQLYGDMMDLIQPKKPYSEIKKQHIGFCNMVVSNARASKRIDFFHKLSAYKKVDSGGKHLNNIGGPVNDKMAFISNYKFSIAFENKSQPGYTTEKLVEPMFCNSMPIYWGNPEINLDFNTKSFLNWNDYGSDEALIERIIELDQNDDLYEKVYNQPYFHENKLNKYCDQERLLNFLSNIFSSPITNKRLHYSRKLTIEYYKTRVFLGSIKNKIIGLLR